MACVPLLAGLAADTGCNGCKAHLRTVGGSLIAASRYGYSNGQRNQVEVFDGASTATEVDGKLQLDNPAHSTTYAYDELQRLVGETRTQRGGLETRETAYTYDAVGNRQQRTHTSSAGTVTTDYDYDANDRLTTETTTDALGTVSRGLLKQFGLLHAVIGHQVLPHGQVGAWKLHLSEGFR